MRHAFAGLGLVVVGALAVSGCDSGIGPGDYEVYRVAFGDVKIADGCDLGPDAEDDKSTLRTSASLILYGGSKEKEVFAEMTFPGGAAPQAVTLTGSGKDNKYTFTGKQTDVSHRTAGGINPTEVEVTTIATYTLSVTVDGERVSGSAKTVVHCDGDRGTAAQTALTEAACGHDDLPFDCSVSLALSGSRVRDLELKHEL